MAASTRPLDLQAEPGKAFTVTLQTTVTTIAVNHSGPQPSKRLARLNPRVRRQLDYAMWCRNDLSLPQLPLPARIAGERTAIVLNDILDNKVRGAAYQM